MMQHHRTFLCVNMLSKKRLFRAEMSDRVFPDCSLCMRLFTCLGVGSLADILSYPGEDVGQ